MKKGCPMRISLPFAVNATKLWTTAVPTAMLISISTAATSGAPLPAKVATVAPAVLKKSPSTFLYVPVILSDGKGFVAQFSVDAHGALRALKPPIVSAGTCPYSVAVDASGRFCYAAEWTTPGAIDQFEIKDDGALTPLPEPRIHTGREPYPITFTPDGKWRSFPTTPTGRSALTG